MEQNYANDPPDNILGYTIRSHTRILISYVLPPIFSVCVYIVQFCADCAVSRQYFHEHQASFGGGTLSLILIPPLLTFILVVTSKDHWNNPQYSNRFHFLGYNLLQLFLFPFFAVYRFGLRIFWSIEALFHANDDKERMLCLVRATESSTCELYLFIQAYAQAAPQIILQMYYMLNQNLFRDYETVTVQAICLVFSAIDLAAITTSYQRFESQRQVGRICPWSCPQEIEAQRRILECDSRLRNECACKKRDSERTLMHFPESDKIMDNFQSHHEDADGTVSSAKTHDVQVTDFDEVDNNNENEMEIEVVALETTALVHNSKLTSMKRSSFALYANLNATDDDKIRSNPKLDIFPKTDHQNDLDEIEILDTIPDTPPPLPPQLRTPLSETAPNVTTRNATQNKRSSRPFSQLETFKNMLIVNAQLYIKDHIPHPPKLLIQRVDNDEQQTSTTPPVTPHSPLPDETDFFLPRPTKIISGIQQEDFAAKSIAFFGWIAYIIMRMLSLGTFSCFYPKSFFIIIGVHFIVMLVALYLESRKEQGSQLKLFLFYPLLAYVYIFVLLEFRVKFKRIRLWFIGYFVITMTENIVMTIIWNSKEELESWWFGFISETITYSGILFVATLVVYYILLKPKDVTLIVE